MILNIIKRKQLDPPPKARWQGVCAVPGCVSRPEDAKGVTKDVSPGYCRNNLYVNGAVASLGVMPRKQRAQCPGGIDHVKNRGVCREPIFKDNQERLGFVRTLTEAYGEAERQVHAYCRGSAQKPDGGDVGDAEGAVANPLHDGAKIFDKRGGEDTLRTNKISFVRFMQVTRAGEYGVLGMLNLARRPPGQVVMIDDISREERIPRSFLGKIFQHLVKAGLVRSTRGAGGGFVMTRPAEDVTVLEVIEAIEGPIALQRCLEEVPNCDQTRSCALCHLLEQAQDRMKEVFSRTTLADLRNSQSALGFSGAEVREGSAAS